MVVSFATGDFYINTPYSPSHHLRSDSYLPSGSIIIINKLSASVLASHPHTFSPLLPPDLKHPSPSAPDWQYYQFPSRPSRGLIERDIVC